MKKIGRTLNIKSNKDAFVVSVAIALLLASALLVTYFVALRPLQAGYTTIYLLDSNRKAVDYPEYLVAGVNSTFSVYVDVEDHLGRNLTNAQVLVKITDNMKSSFPVDAPVTQTFAGFVQDQTMWENMATISLDQPGSYLVFFELWIPNQNGALQFSGNFCVLNVQVAA